MARRLRVLFLTHRLPFPPKSGDRLRAHYLIRDAATWADVDLLSLVADAAEAADAAQFSDCLDRCITLQRPPLGNLARGAAALLTNTPLTHRLLDAPGARQALTSLVAERRPDVVLAYCSSMARFALEPPLAGLPLVVDLVDVDSGKWMALAESSRPPLSWVYRREARCLGRFETRLSRVASRLLVVNERERQAMLALAPDAKVTVVPNGVNVGAFRTGDPPAESARVVFCGVMDYAPNVEAAVWLANDIWPLVRRERADAELQLVGASPSAAVRALADPARGVIVTGSVPDVRPYVWGAGVAVAPLLLARGVQNKALEAVAGGVPCVVTPAVAAGLPAEVLAGCPVAESAGAFAGAILRVLALDPAARRREAAAADIDALDWPRRLTELRAIVEEAAGLPGPPSARAGGERG